MTKDHDLRSRLERLASSAGDPPEHGLDRVAARRHRRLHRRRGAVATATVLAVLAAGLSLITASPRKDPDTVATRDEAGVVGDAPVEVPRLVEVRCEPEGIVVPVGSVRAQNDGLHVRVLNSLGVPTYVRVESTRWDSGEIPVDGPTKEFVQPIPPGQLEIGCEISGSYEARRVDLVDPQRYYTEPELACDTPEEPALRDLPVEPATTSIVAAVLQGLGDRRQETDTVGVVKGYQGQIPTEYTKDPQAGVFRGDDLVARVHVRGADGSAGLPYSSISLVEACPDALTAPTTTTSSTAPTSPTSVPAA
ncbi:MAG TPA: hypothetical protein VFB94_03085 [Acidimicrobiales bacterium]|nr:hypothetical protein [Acidimicrobiales bacterium]